MASNQSGSPLGLRLVPPHERSRDAEIHLPERRAAVFNSVLVLRDAKYLLLESQRTDGTWVGTRMWFAAVNDTIFLRTKADSPKVRRTSRRPIVKVTPCTRRGKPLDDYIKCMAHIAPQAREAQAEAALCRGYGLLRRLVNVLTHNHYVYLELTPLDRKSYRGRKTALRSRESGPCARTASNPEKAPPDAA